MTQQFTPTPEQQEAIRLFATGESLVIEAGAGTGKTSTLKLLAESTKKHGQYIAFNKAIVTEAGAKMPSHVACSTAHSLAYRNVVGSKNPWIADRLRSSRRMKSSEIADRLGIDAIQLTTFAGEHKRLAKGYLAGLCMRGITRFCQSADVEPDWNHVPLVDGVDAPRGPKVNNREIARRLVPAMRKAWTDLTSANGQLPFKHDHYLKMWQLDSPRINADFILFDEAQDANPVLLDIVRQQTHAQLVWVGDSQQQIYTFTGAVNALAKVGATHRTFLTQSFRFGPAVADVANDVLDMLPDAELRLVGFDKIDSKVGPVNDPDVVLCRTNARAVRHFLDALKEGKKPHIVGGGREVVDFAKGARDLMEKHFTAHPELACFESWGEVQSYVEQDEQGGDLRLLVSLIDEFGVNVIIDSLERMPEEARADVVISTAHKSKGREWDMVMLADDFPAEPKGEELRLLYVAVTRAKLVLDVTNVKLLAEGFEPVDPVQPPASGMLVDPDWPIAASPVAPVTTEPESTAETPSEPDEVTGDFYVDSVRWIAANDEPTITEPAEIEQLLTVVMLADVTHTPIETVSVDVAHVRLGPDSPYGFQSPREHGQGTWECSCGRKIYGNAAAASHMKAHKRRSQNHYWTGRPATKPTIQQEV